MSRFLQYLKDTRGELKHVSWPTRSQAIIFTILVIVVSIFVAFFLGFFDFIFTRSLDIFFLDGNIDSSSAIPLDQSTGVPSEVPTADGGGEGTVQPTPGLEFTPDIPEENI